MCEINSEYFEKVEEILNKYPDDCRKNYYKNKETLKINFKEQLNSFIEATYDSENNEINLYGNKNAIYHELFHMAFNSRNKYGKLIENGKNLCYDNGLSLKDKKNNNKYFTALTEGFVEYLTRKIIDIKGQKYNYFFADLLISIYGEEIIEYALKNDPIRFFDDNRFKNVIKYARYLDELNELNRNLEFVAESYRLNILKELKEKSSSEILENYKELIEITKKNLAFVIPNLFILIKEEFYFCENPKITLEDLKVKIQSFFEQKEYSEILDLIDEEQFLKFAKILDNKTKNQEKNKKV